MSIATTAVHLYAGLEDERLRQKSQSYPNEGLGGFIELASDIENHAVWLEEIWEAEHKDRDYPGVYDYDITQELGGWLYHNWDAGKQAFIDELRRMFNKAMEQS